ncbi:LCP family protein [Phytoactinopolyspora halotolerans]|uniref:LytR family transcriptional regulator n=1 Tax=Phytoactinopolyspora halotolerans TaxID=1981512 RepID=A0A6L9S3G4_9ACTN|nr:LCP family protein [Phytoactinopolyspora halotolerans]NED99592.1 LytR family transcriptional regulator [Phytoactinopolyspora halotolerans]
MTMPIDDLMGSGDNDGSGRDSTTKEKRRRRRNRIILLTVLAMLLGIVVAVAGGGLWLVNRYLGAGNIERIPNAFDIPETDRPSETTKDSLTILLGGLDGGTVVDDDQPGAARTDTIMMVHFPEGRDRGYVVSIPRDTYIDIPGHGPNKINAAYSFGGPALFVQTVEQLTDLRMDHLMLIDWTGFTGLTDAVGGVPMEFSETTILNDGSELPPGRHVLDGEQALEYVRVRKSLPNGDFDRVKRQQNFLRSLMNEVIANGRISSFGRVTDIADAVGDAVRVDENLSALDMARMAWSMRDLRAGDVTFLTVPTRGTGRAGQQSIVNYDDALATELWTALAEDEMNAFLAENAELVTGEQVR